MKSGLNLIVVLALATSGLAQKKEIHVFVDERTELITVTQLLFGYPLVGKTDIGYKKEVLNTFQKYENDTTVNYLLKITQNDFSFSKPFLFTYHFSFPQFTEQSVFTEQDVQDLNYDKRKEKLLLFNRNLRDFYTRTDFHSFYKNHQPFYDRMTAPVADSLRNYHLVQALEEHYGQRQASYNLVLSPLSIEAGMSVWIKGKDGYNLYAIVGPKIDSKTEPRFDIKVLIQKLVVHEFSHPFCNPVIDANYATLEKDSCLFNPIKSQLKEQGCGDWRSALKELFTRANEIVITGKLFDRKTADIICNEYISQGWTYIQGLRPLIEKYVANRKKYKTIQDIVPEVILYFNTELAKTRK